MIQPYSCLLTLVMHICASECAVQSYSEDLYRLTSH